MSSPSTSDQTQRKKRKRSRRSKKSSKKYSQFIIAGLLVAILALAIVSLINVDEVKSDPDNAVSLPTEEEFDPADPANWEMLLKTGTSEELLDALVNSEGRRERATKNPVLNYVRYSQRAAIAKRLLQSDIGESQKRYVTMAYLEDLRNAEILNIAAKLGFKESRESVLQAARQYSNAQQPEIAAQANLLPVFLHLSDFWAERDPRHLDLVRTQLDQTLRLILKDPETAVLLVSVVFRLNKDPDYPNETTALLWHILNQFESQVTPETAEILTSFRDLLNFGDLEIEKLPQLVLDEDPFAAEQVRRLFDVLARNPKAGKIVYRQAILVVGSYEQLGQEQLANILKKRLRDTAMRIEDAEKREMVLAEIENPQLIPDEAADTDETDFGIDLPNLPDLSELQPER